MERNIKKMASFLRGQGVALRAHAKTPKCPAICLQQITAGAIGICASKLGEAEDLAAGGIHDIFTESACHGSGGWHAGSPRTAAPRPRRLGPTG